MFGLFKKDKNAGSDPCLLAPCDGKAIDITTLPDPVFADKILGDGFAVNPSSEDKCDILSPIDGRIIDVQDSLHAYGIETPSGAEILVHVGINTVSLNGEGFKAHVKNGDKVKAGQPLCTADVALIHSKGLAASVVVLITNADEYKNFSIAYGECKGGETAVLTAEKA